MKSKLIIFGVVFAVVLSFSLYVYWGTRVTSIEFNPNNSLDSAIDQAVPLCVGSVSNQSFFSLDEKSIEKKVIDCDPRITTANVQTSFPQKVVISYKVIEPVLRLNQNSDESCLVVESFAVMKSLAKEYCLLLRIPEITGAVKADNPFMLSYVVELVSKLRTKEIMTEKVTVQSDGYSSYYEIDLATKKKILVPDGANIDSKILVIYESLKGLEQSKEGYSVVDFRIDTVIYR